MDNLQGIDCRPEPFQLPFELVRQVQNGCLQFSQGCTLGIVQLVLLTDLPSPGEETRNRLLDHGVYDR